MRSKIIACLLAVVFTSVLLHQLIGLIVESHDLKDKWLPFDKDTCLKQLNAAGGKRIHPETRCHKLYLRDLEGEPTESFGF